MSSPEFCYTAFGLRIGSQISLPELPAVRREAPATPVDVEIRLGEVTPSLPGATVVGPGVTGAGDTILIDFPEARYLIRNGREIVVQPAPGTPERDVRVYLLGRAMAAICHQRRLMPLHANAIEVDGQAVVIVGPSGAGKSTLAAYFHQRGYRVLCDDVCVVSFDAENRPVAWPGIPRIKLWSDALKAFGQEESGLEPVVSGLAKFSLPMPHEVLPGPIPVSRVYAFGPAAKGLAEFRRLSGPDAVNAVVTNVYRWELAVATGAARRQFDQALAVVRHAAVFDVGRRWGFRHFADDARRLEAHVANRALSDPDTSRLSIGHDV